MQLSLDLDAARKAGERAMRAAESHAERREPSFTERASDFMRDLLLTKGPMSGEALTDACIAAGFDVSDTRAYGAAFRCLVTLGARVVGFCPRRKGHGSSGGKVYAIGGQ